MGVEMRVWAYWIMLTPWTRMRRTRSFFDEVHVLIGGRGAVEGCMFREIGQDL